MAFELNRDPGVNDDANHGFNVNGEWVNPDNQKRWRCNDNANAAADWEDITPGSGDVTGPGVSVDDRIAAFDGTTGTLLKQGSKTATEVGDHLDAVAQHRVINDSGTSTIELWSASKIDSVVSAIAEGTSVKPGVDTSTTGEGNITLSGEQTLNGLLTSSSRVLVTEQTVPADNGIYDTAAGAWSRAADADEDAEVSNGNLVYVTNTGSTKVNCKYLLVTTDPIAVGVTAQDWEETCPVEFGTTGGTATEGNDSRVPTQDENDALAGTSGTPSSINKYVTNADPRNSDARAPTAHTVASHSDITATGAQLDAHLASVANPHGVTAAQAGADPAGSAAAVQTNLTTHEGDFANPHGVTAAQSGATPAAHASDFANPHAVTVAQTGGDTAGTPRPPTAHTHTHASTTGKTANDHHNEDHAARHSTGGDDAIDIANIGGDAAGTARPPTTHALDSHTGDVTDVGGDLAGTARPPTAHTVASHSDTTATGAQLNTLVGGGDANGLHTHAPAQLFHWNFSTNTTAADPGAGNVRLNNATPASITAIYFSSVDGAGLDFDNFFAEIPIGDKICAQQTDDASKRISLTVSGALTDNAGWWTVPVTVDSDAGGLFQNNRDTSWLIHMRI